MNFDSEKSEYTDTANFCSYITEKYPFDKEVDRYAVKYYLENEVYKHTHIFSEAMSQNSKMLNPDIHKLISENGKKFNEMIISKRDYELTWKSLLILSTVYLMRDENKKLIETPQFMFMRVAIQMYGTDMKMVKKVYDQMANLEYLHATPTLLNSCRNQYNLSSCFIVELKDDSIEGIQDTIKECMIYSKYCGGIAASITNLRSSKESPVQIVRVKE
jgi:ribonucleotide reductase alpha subunit